ncbi:MAG: MbnP family protein [Bacteroidota bacterium]
MFVLRNSLIVLGMVLYLQSCYSPVEGCTDPESTNYAITADDLCLDCCEYPDLMLNIFHENMDTTFNLADTITNDLDQQISLVDFVYLLSDFEVSVEDEVYEVSDSVSLDVEDGIAFAKDDIIRVERSVFSYDLGTIIFDGDITELAFRTGLTDVLNENRFTDEIEDHPLTTDPDSLYQSDTETYVFQRLKVAQGSEFRDTVIYDITQSTKISFPIVEIESLRGTDKTIIIEAQYNRWFDGVDFTTMSKDEIEELIALNNTFVFRQKD